MVTIVLQWQREIEMVTHVVGVFTSTFHQSVQKLITEIMLIRGVLLVSLALGAFMQCASLRRQVASERRRR